MPQRGTKEFLSLALLDAQQIIEEQERKLIDAQPAIVFHQAVAVTEDTILVREFAKLLTQALRKEGYKVGLIRPKTLWPFPNKAFKEIPNAKNLLVVEMSLGQMRDDVKLACECKLPVHFYGRSGGMIPTPAAIAEKAKEILGEVALGGVK